MNDFPFHLLFPLTAGFLFVIGALFTKHASTNGVSPWTLAVVANFCAAAFFSVFWMLGGEPITPGLLWQPLLIGALYVIGQTLLLSAISFGDVSVAMPVASLKVIIVAAMMVFLTSEPPSLATWCAALLAALGVFLINYVAPKSDKMRILMTVATVIAGITSFALFDVCIQNWSPHWGTGRILPLSFWSAGLLSVFLLPKVDSLATIRSGPWKSVLFSGSFIGGQAMFMVYGLSTYGDAARMNVVYSVRGLWAVLLAWGFAKSFGGAEANLPPNIMIARVCGATLLVIAVIVAIVGN